MYARYEILFLSTLKSEFWFYNSAWIGWFPLFGTNYKITPNDVTVWITSHTRNTVDGNCVIRTESSAEIVARKILLSLFEMSVNSDILVEISDYNLPKLAALYKNHMSWAPHVVALVRTAIQWKQLEDYRDAINFYSPNNCWETDGTVIVTTTFSGVEVYVLTLDEECTNLYKGLTETKIFDKATQHFLFFGVHERWVATVRKSILHINREIEFDTPCYLYAISPGEAKQLKADCPPEVYVKRLGTSAAPLVDRTWPHSFEGSVDYLAKFLAINGGYGVFLKSNDEMVASVLRFAIGNISLLYTEEKHRNKGYASLMVRVLSKEIGEEGLWPVATIITDNQNSLHMFEKLGFLNLGKTYFIGVK